MDPIPSKKVKVTMKNPFLVVPDIVSALGQQGSTNDLRLLRQLSTGFHYELSQGYFDLLDKKITWDLDKMTDGNGDEDEEICAPLELPHICRQLRVQRFQWIDSQFPSRLEHLYFLQQLCPFITSIDIDIGFDPNGEHFNCIQVVKMFSEHKLKVLRMKFSWDYHPTERTLMDQILKVVNPYSITVEVTLFTRDLIGMDEMDNLLQSNSNLGVNLRITVESGPELLRRLTEMVTMKHTGRIQLFGLYLSLDDLHFPEQSEELVTKCVQALLPWVQKLIIDQGNKTTPWNLLSLDTQLKFPDLTYLDLWKYDGPLLFLRNFPNLESFDLSDWSVSSMFCDGEKSEEENLEAIFGNLKKLQTLLTRRAVVPQGDSRFERLQDGGNLNTYLRSLLPEDCIVTVW